MARLPIIVVCAALAIAALAGAEPQAAGSSRAELARWLERLGASGTEVGKPLPWRYSFSAAATANLEAPSVELVAAGYVIEALAPGFDGGRAQLTVTRVELMTPAALERRNRELSSLAGKHRVRYDGLDVAAPAAR